MAILAHWIFAEISNSWSIFEGILFLVIQILEKEFF